jgi:hypothetical protein
MPPQLGGLDASERLDLRLALVRSLLIRKNMLKDEMRRGRLKITIYGCFFAAALAVYVGTQFEDAIAQTFNLAGP